MTDALLRFAQLSIAGIALSFGVASAALPASSSRSRHTPGEYEGSDRFACCSYFAVGAVLRSQMPPARSG